MANILDTVTLGAIKLIDVDANPASGAGTAALLGDLASDPAGALYVNRDGTATNWRRVPQQVGNAALSVGQVLFPDSNGDLSGTSAFFWDNVNTRLGLGLSAPVSRLHIDAGTGTGSHLRFTAGTTTGQASTDGFQVGIDSSANGEIKQLENLPINFFTNNTQRFQITAAGLGVFNDAIRVGNTADTTNGNIWYDGTDFFGRLGGTNVSLTATPAYQASTDTSTTTTSLTFVSMTSMSITPIAGTYVCRFLGEVSNTNGGKAVEVKLMIDGTTDIVGTLRHQESNPGGSRYGVSCEARVTLNGSQTLGVYWRVDANTGTAYSRSLILTKVQPL